MSSLSDTHFIRNLNRPGENLLDVVQPVGRLEVAQPPLVLDVWEAHVLDLAKAFTHHVDVVDVEEDQLRTVVMILILIASSPRHVGNCINLWSRIVNVNPVKE